MESNEKLLKKLNNGREYRAMRLEVRTADPAAPDASQEVEGYACTFNQPYLLYEYMGDSGTTCAAGRPAAGHSDDDCHHGGGVLLRHADRREKQWQISKRQAAQCVGSLPLFLFCTKFAPKSL